MRDDRSAVKVCKFASARVIVPAGKLLLRFLSGVLAGIVIVLAFGAWRLTQGPLSLGFLSPYVAQALAYGEAGFSADVENTVLTWGGWNRNLEVHAKNVRLIQADGTVLASIPELTVNFSIRALAHLRIAPTSLALIGGRATVVRNADGHFDFGLVIGPSQSDAAGPAPGAKPSVDIMGLMIDELSRADSSGPTAYLTHASLIDASLVVDDRKLGIVWQVPRATVALWREPGGVRGDGSLNVRLGERLAQLSAAAHYIRADNSVTLRMAFANLEPALFANVSPALADLKAVGLPLTGTVGFALDGSGRFRSIDFNLAGGAGTIDLQRYAALQPLNVKSLSLSGRVMDDLGLVTLDRAAFDLGDAAGEAHGTVGFSGGLAVDLRATLAHLETEALQRYWPADMAAHGREWIIANISGGVVTDVALKAKVTSAMLDSGNLPDDAVVLDFKFAGLAVHYFRPLPKLEDVDGSARLTPKGLDLVVTRGNIGDLQLEEGKVSIADFDKVDQTAAIEFVIRGPTRSALALLNHKPLGFVRSLGLDPQAVDGLSATRARFAFPLRNDLTSEKIDVVAASNITDASIPDVMGRYKVSGGTFALRVDKQRLEADGAADVQGVPAKINWQEEFSPAPGRYASRYRITGTVDAAGRAALGYPMDPFITGPVGAALDIRVWRKGDVQLSARLDLQPAALDFAFLHWKKKPGDAAAAQFDLATTTGGAIHLSGIGINAADFSARGEADITDGKLTRVAVPRLTYGRNDFALKAVRDQAGTFDIDTTGASFDLRPYLDDVFATSEPDATPGPSLNFKAQFGRMAVAEGVDVIGLTASGRRQGDTWAELIANGQLAGKSSIDLRVLTSGKRRQVTVTSDDAGDVVKALGISDDTVGGRFDLTGEIADDEAGAPIRGQLRMADFKVVHAPAMAKLLTVASLTGIGDLLRGEGISFVRADVPFTATGGTIKIENSRAWGAAIGVTASGTVDRGHDTINLNGTVIPAYTINRVLGAIPLIGNILVGREGEGIIGITYSVSGAASDPQVSVNPLSALAPGILRRMFEPSASSASGSAETNPGGTEPGLPGQSGPNR
ncbi:MAG TPA: AsmA-like C-terminal domain-containing protein [Candidatus Cybelea sp.]|nr:AsmA-like C-terminal domain-containing protein [Candidatus Cybelea sp.]